MVSIGSVCSRHYVGLIEGGRQSRMGLFKTAAEASTKAAAECVLLGLPRTYADIRRDV